MTWATMTGVKTPKPDTDHRPSPKPLVIPVFLPHAGCPHRCLFCNQHCTTGKRESLPDTDAVRSTVGRYLAYGKPDRGAVEIAFFGGNFLGLATPDMVRLLDVAAEFVRRGEVDGIRFSTRPDTITPERLAALALYPVTTIELGVQSMNDAVLKHVRRGHTAEDTLQAVRLLKARGYTLGLQMMVGLPGDDDAGALSTGHKLAEMTPDFVRIYPTLVLEGSPLAQAYRQGRYTPMDLEACVKLVKKLLLILAEHKIQVIRMGLQPTTELNDRDTVLAGPYHPAFGDLVYTAVFKDALIAHLKDLTPVPKTLSVCVHPHNRSRLQGQRFGNINALKSIFSFTDVIIRNDAALSKSILLVDGRVCRLPI